MHRPRHKYWMTRWSAEKRGIAFNLSLDDFIELVQKPCAYGNHTNVGLDRKDNSLGYSRENCVPCCYKHNAIKSGYLSFEDMLRVVAECPSAKQCGDKVKR